MLILALESSAKPVSVAVYEHNGGNDSSSGVFLGNDFQNSGYSHSRTLLAMTEAMLNNLNLRIKDIDLIAVAAGPGSFTGVRIGMAAAKGLAFGSDIPICSVSTLEAMAYQAVHFLFPSDIPLICPVMDARREQVYTALFEYRDNGVVRLCEDRAISIESLASDLINTGRPYMLIGDGTDLVTKRFTQYDIRRSVPVPVEIKYQSAAGVASAAIHNKQTPASIAEPVYLRPSQAERVRSENN